MALNLQTNINKERSYFLSTIPESVIFNDVVCNSLFANVGFISTLKSDDAEVSTLKASTFTTRVLDLSEGSVSTLRGNLGRFSTLHLVSDLSGGLGRVNFTADASGVVVSGDPIIFNNIVFLTSSINVVQVSTIVDATILAQNGFFSTLSSGSFSTNQTSINEANISSLTVSSIQAFDISGDFAINWSQYPTLASSIIFQPGNVLSNVGAKIFFAGTELTDLSGGGEDWSSFPALQDVSMNNFSLRGLSTLQYQDGARLVSQTGNNLLYNGLPVQFGATSNVSQWANFPAVNTLQTAGFPISSIGNLTMTANSNIRLLANSVSTVADQGLLNPTLNSDINLTAQNGLKGRINMTANPGALGLFGEINMTANGGTVGGIGTGGLITLNANTPLGTLCNATSAIKLNAAGVNSYAGGIPSIGSLAGYNYVYGTAGVNITTGIPSILPNVPLTTFIYGTAGVTVGSDLYAPNLYPYFDGINTPPDLEIEGRVVNLGQQVFVRMSNVRNIAMDGLSQISNLKTLNMSNGSGVITDVSTINGVPFGEVVQSSNIVCSNITVAQSTITTTLDATSTFTDNLIVPQQAVISTLLTTFTFATSSVMNNLSLNNIRVADDITGVTNAPMPLQSRIVNFSSINSFAISTTDLYVSSINGQAVDASGGLAALSSYQTLTTSTLNVSSINQIGGVAIKVDGFLEFANPLGGTLGNCFQINIDDAIADMTIRAQRINLQSVDNTTTGSLSTLSLGVERAQISSIQGDSNGFLTVTSDLILTQSLFIPPTRQLVFDTGPSLGLNQVASQTMPCLSNSGAFGSNLGSLAANEFFIGTGTGAFGAAKLYSIFPSDNFGIDIIDANGATLFEAINCYDTGGQTFQTNLYGTSSIVGFNGATGFDNRVTAPTISTQNLLCSTINGLPPFSGMGGSTISTFAVLEGAQFFTSSIQGFPVGSYLNTNQFSTLFTSTMAFSSILYSQSNTGFYYPILLDQDHAKAVPPTIADGVAIAVRGHNFQTGAAISQIEFGSRGNGDSYIMSLWPGQNLEDLYIDATDTIFNNGTLSTIINQGAGLALQSLGAVVVPNVSTLALTTSSIVANTGIFNTLSTQTIFANVGIFSTLSTQTLTAGSVSTQQLFVSSILGNDARPAYTTNFQTSTMALTSGVAELGYWASRTPNSNITVSGYDTTIVVNGTYKMGCRIQGFNGGIALEELILGFNLNSVAIPDVQTTQEITAGGEDSIYMECLVSCVAGDNLQVVFFTADNNIQVFSTAGSPAAILTVYKID